MPTLRFDLHQPDFPFKQRHPPGANPPTLASFPPSHQGNQLSTPSYQQYLPLSPTLQHISDYGATVPPGIACLSKPPIYGGLPSRTGGGPMQYDQMYLQIQSLRQQNEARQVGMSRHFASHNGTGPSPTPPPFGASGPLHCGFDKSEGRPSMVCKRGFPGYTDS